jgi:antitoxin ParD1/3/4
MVISLPLELEEFARRQVEAGKYASVEDVLADGVRALIDREELYQGRFEELCQEVQIGISELERGESQDLETAMDSIRQNMRQRYGDS